MRLLFVKLKHIGDSLLLTPTLAAARLAYPQAEIWVVVRKGCEGILAGCSAIDEIRTTAAPESARRSHTGWISDARLIFELRRRHFDYAFELTDGDRGRCLAWLSSAKIRCASGQGWPLNWWWKRALNGIAHFNWQTHHRVEKDFYTVHEFLPLKEPVPALVFEKSKTVPWAPAAELSDFVVIHPGTRWERKRWPEEKWLATCSWLLGKTKNIVISAGPDAAEILLAQRLQCVLGNAVLSTQGQCNWAQLAGLLSRAKLFVGVDTAAMHLAAACQCPSVALFGPSTVHEWRPWQVRHVLIEPQESNQIPGVVEDPRLAIRSIGVDPVKQACQKLLDAAN